MILGIESPSLDGRVQPGSTSRIQQGWSQIRPDFNASIAASRKHILYPTALGPITDGFACDVFDVRGIQADGKKLANDLPLSGFGRFRAGSAAAGVLHRQVKRRGPGFVFQRRISPAFEQAFHRGGASGADRAVQGRGAIFVRGINDGSGVEEALDGSHPPVRIPKRRQVIEPSRA